MYLIKVYRHSKLLFAAILFFVTMQIVVTLKHGMVITPWYNYGMYSAVEKPKKNYQFFIATTGSDTLKGYRYSPAHWDKLTYMPIKITATQKAAFFYETEVKRQFVKWGGMAPAKHLFVANADSAALMQWNNAYLQAYFRMKQPVIVHAAFARWNGNTLVPIASPLP